MNEVIETIGIVIGALCVITVLCIPIVKSTRWYRVRKFGEMREALKNMDIYEIKRSKCLFGSFWDVDSHRPVAVLKAYGPQHALERYFRLYRRKYNEFHEYDGKTMRETTYSWGVYQVKNTRTGFKHYYM